MNEMTIPQEVHETIQSWLNGSFDEKTKGQVRALLELSAQKTVDAFYQKLSFGTGGLRALMGVGTNRINTYTVAFATQAIANCLNKKNREEKKLVVIAFDSRNHSQEFATTAAEVLLNNGIDVYMGASPLPTPFLSFCVRRLAASAGIMITASHNPAEYNGYKVYGNDGGQVLPPFSDEILDEYNSIYTPSQLEDHTDKGTLYTLPKEIEEEYIETCCKLCAHHKLCADKGSFIKIVYTNLHGTGIAFIPKLFTRVGFTNYTLVEEQAPLDGNFPTVAKPNPEEFEALSLGIKQLNRQDADLLLATDPDADRVSCVVRDTDGTPVMLSGNQIASLLIHYLLHHKKQSGLLTPNHAAIKTIVTTELFRSICDFYKVQCVDVPTGFKYIGQTMEEFEQDSPKRHFVLGAEESFGYLAGTYARDKDACSAAQLIAECALAAKVEGKNLLDRLEDLYKTFGFFYETQRSAQFSETQEGRGKLNALLKTLDSPETIKTLFPSATRFTHYKDGIVYNLSSNENTPSTFPSISMYKIEMPQANIFVRPSGTEPKIKFYFHFLKQDFFNRKEQIEACEKLADQMIESI